MVRDKKTLLVGAFTVATLLLAACGANSGDKNENATSVSSTGSAISTSVAPSETGTSSVSSSGGLSETNGVTESNGLSTTGTETAATGVTGTNGVSTTGTETAGSGVTGTNGLTESNGTSSAVGTETPSALVTSTESSSVVSSTNEMTSTSSAGSVGSTSEVTSTSEAVSTTTSGSSGTSGSNGGTATTTGTPEAMPSTLNGNLVSSLFTAFAQALTNNAAVTPTGTTENAQPYTVFVPTGQAFDQIGATLLSGVTTNGNSTNANGTTGLLNNSVLAQVFSYHIVKGRYTAADLAKVTELTTISGLTLTVSNKDGVIYINNARVVQADVQNNGPASNTSNTNLNNQGAIHLIDSVLVPPNLSGLNNGSGSSNGVGSSTTTTDTNSSSSSTPTATP